MRLWHSKLIPLLDGRRLCDLHMSCCNLRGNGWGKKNRNINYIYDDPCGEDALAVYHRLVLAEMGSRDYKFDSRWYDGAYCGKNRPRRTVNVVNYRTACRREAPLKGHTMEFYLNDVKTLQERGLGIQTQCELAEGSFGPVKIYRATRAGVETAYLIRK